jgi:signal transduction histidine kinase
VDVTSSHETDDDLETLRRKVEDYEHRFALLDGQMRVLEKERQKLSAVVNNSDAGFMVIDSSFRLIWANNLVGGLIGGGGAHPGVLFGQSCNQVLCGRDRICDICPASQALRTGQVAHREILLEVGGERRDLYTTSMPIMSPDGRIEETMVMIQDVSGLGVLRQEKARVQLLQEVAVAANQARGIDEAIRICLDRVCAFTGWPVGNAYRLAPDASGELIPTKLWHLDDAERYEAFRKISDQTRFKPGIGLPGRVLESGRPAWIVDVTKDANFPPALAAPDIRVHAGFGFPVLVGHEVAAVLEFFSPETIEPDEGLMQVMGHIGTQLGRVIERERAHEALRRSEEQLRHAQKMEAIGRLAGGIAHDFNNLLTVITGHSELLMRQLGSDHPASQQLGEIRRSGNRAAALTRQLLAFGRKQVLQPRLLDLNAVIRGMESMLRRLIGESINLVTDLQPVLGSVEADPGQMEQVIMNLVVNARDAMPSNGSMTISTTETELEGIRDAQQAPMEKGRYVVLAVSDTGHGMDDDTRVRIFEPFFTTKEVGKGTGLGLSMVYGIIRQTGGYILLDTGPARGSTFRICLPRVQGLPSAIETPVISQASLEGTETILLVEDETIVRNLVREVLQLGGYNVLEAEDPVDARLICERFEGRIDLMVTDVVMPVMSGLELAEYLAPMRPEMKVLYMSGYTDETLDPSMAFLPKPFTPDDLAQRVRELLDAAH